MLRPDFFLCRDCDVDTGEIHEIYMVTNEVWTSAGASTESDWGCLCIGCLESRLKRQLMADDFKDVRLTHDWRKCEQKHQNRMKYRVADRVCRTSDVSVEHES